MVPLPLAGLESCYRQMGLPCKALSYFKPTAHLPRTPIVPVQPSPGPWRAAVSQTITLAPSIPFPALLCLLELEAPSPQTELVTGSAESTKLGP